MARRALRNNNRCDKQFSNQVNDKFGGSPPTFEQRVLYKKINSVTFYTSVSRTSLASCALQS